MGTEFEKIAHLVAPLFPVTHTDAPAQPVINNRDGSAHSFALGLPPDGTSRCRPCPRLMFMSTLTSSTGFTHRGPAPHKFTPMPGVHNRLQGTANSAAVFLSHYPAISMVVFPELVAPHCLPPLSRSVCFPKGEEFRNNIITWAMALSALVGMC
jgi:hypothetical protein